MANITTLNLTAGVPTGPAGSTTVSSLDGVFQTANGPIAIKPASIAPTTSDPSLVVSISPNSINANGRASPANSAPMVFCSQAYNTIAASQTAQVLTGGGGGAIGDWLDVVLIVPASTSPGTVSITDGSGSAIVIFSGGVSSVASLVPFAVPIRAVSASGAWKITTGSAVTAIATGNFH